MPRFLRLASLAPLLGLAAAPLAAQQALPADSLAIARRAAGFFYAGQVDSLMAMMSPAILADIGGREGLMNGITQVSLRAGDEASVVEERWNLRNGARQYWRTSTMTQFPEPFLLRFNIDAAGLISGIGMGPASSPPPVDSVGPALPRP